MKPVFALILIAAISPATAQTFPSQPIHIVVPQPAGGLVDTVARMLQPHLEKGLGATVVVENKPGASGITATGSVINAKPDGHTLLITPGSLTVTAATSPKIPFDTGRDLVAIAMVTENPMWVVINAKHPAKTLAEFLALVKSNPDKYFYATTGLASFMHLATERMLAESGTYMKHVPYPGGPAAMQAVVKGEADFLIIVPSVAQPHIQSGAIKVIATGGVQRDKSYPDVPTVIESGFPGYAVVTWVGLLTSAKTPKPIIDRINSSVTTALRDDDLRGKIQKLGADPATGTADQFGLMVRTELDTWNKVAKTAGIVATD